jgi:hypothetical protein
VTFYNQDAIMQTLLQRLMLVVVQGNLSSLVANAVRLFDSL